MTKKIITPLMKRKVNALGAGQQNMKNNPINCDAAYTTQNMKPVPNRGVNALANALPSRGGARPNAGAPRKSEPLKQRSIRLSDADWERFKELGGAQWIREQISFLTEF